MDNRSNRKNKNRRSRRSARVVATVLAALMIFSTAGGFVNAEEVTESTETAAVEEPEDVSVPSGEDSSTVDESDTVPDDEEVETPSEEGEGETDTNREETSESGTEEAGAKQNDLIVDEEEQEAEEADTPEEDQKAEASTFTISYSVFNAQRILYYVHAVDEDGQEISLSDAKDVEISSSEMSFSFAEYALSADGYTYKEARVDKTNGSAVTDVGLSVTGSALSVSYKNGDESVENTSVSLTDDTAKESRDIYFVYEKESTPSAGSDEKTLSDGTKVSFTWSEDAGLTEGTKGTASLVIDDTDTNYQDQISSYLGDDFTINDVRFFEIHLEKNGEKVQPEKPINVNITLSDPLSVDENSTIRVFHFKDSSTIESISPEYEENDGSVDSVSFKASSFSVYAIADGSYMTARRTYEFYLSDKTTAYTFQDENGNTVSSQTVKNGDTLQDPGIPTNSSGGSKFMGWYTVDGDTKVDITREINDITTNETVKLYAKFGEYTVTYYDEDGDILTTEIVDGGDYTPSYDYTAHTSGYTCIGWTTNSNGGSTRSDVESTVNITADTSLYPVVAQAHWITFEAEGGLAVSSQYVLPGDTLSTLPTTTRTGYTFAGWYTAATGGTQVTDADGSVNSDYQSISADLTVYAHWIPNTDTKYTIAYWLENADDDLYTYQESVTATGTTGESTSVRGSSYVANDRYSGFHLYGSGAASVTGETENDSSYQITEQTIAADGSTVVNVYYNRDWYTITFQSAESYSRTSYVHTSGNYYYYFPGGYVSNGSRYQRYSAGYYAVGSAPITSPSYDSDDSTNPYYFAYYTDDDDSGTINSQTEVHYYYYYTYTYNEPTTYNDLTIYAKYESDIREKWPSNVSESYSSAWQGADSTDTYIWTGYYVMPLNGRTFTEYNASGDYTFRRYYYLMQTDGTYKDADDSKNTELADFHEDLKGSSATTWSLVSFYPMQGFTVNTEKSDQLGTDDNRNNGTDIGNNIQAWYIYYDRNKYDVEFYDGSSLIETKSYYYGADISGADDDINTDKEGYVFEGWYTLPSSAGYGDQYTFSGTMPAGNIAVYAKYTAITHTVTYDTNGGYFLDDNNNRSTSKSDTLNYGEKATEYTVYPSSEAYTFVGWFAVDESGNVSSTPYNFSDSVTSDIILKAVWRDTGTYKVTYNSNGGGTAPMDSSTYLNAASVTVKGAPESVPAGKVFVGWQVLKNDGSGNPVNGTIYQPGEQFELDSTEMAVAAEEGPSYDGTITLKAVYQDVDTTNITLNGNGDSDAPATVTLGTGYTDSREGYEVSGDGTTAVSITDLAMNASIDLSKVTATREGYKLIGWSTDPTTKSKGFKADGKTTFSKTATVGVDGTEGNTLYAVWQDERLTTITVAEVTTGNAGDPSQEFSYTATYYESADGEQKTVTFTLKSGETYDLTTYAGKEVTVTQTPVTDYDLSISDAGYGGTADNSAGTYTISSVPQTAGTVTFTNNKEKIESETTSNVSKIIINKVWKDESGETMGAPDGTSITATVYDSDGNSAGSVTLNEENSWTGSVDNLSSSTTYHVEETSTISGYTTKGISGPVEGTELTAISSVSAGQELVFAYTSGNTTYLLTRSGTSIVLTEATHDAAGNINPTAAQKWTVGRTAFTYEGSNYNYYTLTNGGYYLSLSSSGISASDEEPTEYSSDTALYLRRSSSTIMIESEGWYRYLGISGTSVTLISGSSTSSSTGTYMPTYSVTAETASYTITNTKKPAEPTPTVSNDAVAVHKSVEHPSGYADNKFRVTLSVDVKSVISNYFKYGNYFGVNASSSSFDDVAAGSYVTGTHSHSYNVSGTTNYNKNSGTFRIVDTNGNVLVDSLTLYYDTNANNVTFLLQVSDNGYILVGKNIQKSASGTQTITLSTDAVNALTTAAVSSVTLSKIEDTMGANITYEGNAEVNGVKSETGVSYDSASKKLTWDSVATKTVEGKLIDESVTSDNGTTTTAKAYEYDGVATLSYDVTLNTNASGFKSGTKNTVLNGDSATDGEDSKNSVAGPWYNTNTGATLTYTVTGKTGNQTIDFPTPLVQGEKADTPLTGMTYDRSSRIILLLVLCFAVAGAAGFWYRRKRKA